MAADRKVFCFLMCSVGAILVAIVGVLLLSVVYSEVQDTLEGDINDFLVLASPDSQAYPAWVDSDNPDAGTVTSTYWVYNVTNPAGILAGEPPALVEVGPLTYIYHNKKYNVSWDPDNYGDIVSFKQYQYYTPADDATAALGGAYITSLNVPLLSILSNPITAYIVASSLNASLAAYTAPGALFVNRTVAEVVWGWPDDPFLTTFNGAKPWYIPAVPAGYQGIQNNDSSLAYALATHSPNRMHTGVGVIDNIMQMASWDGYNVMMCCAFGPCGDSNSGAGVVAPYSPWGSDDANGISGSEGSQFAPGTVASDTLRVETYDFGIYRHWDLTCPGGATYDVQGIRLLRFSLAPLTMCNYSMNAAEGAEYNAYGPAGLLNQSNCDSGAPIFLSKPRFLGGDPSLRAALANFPAPVPAEHDTWLGVEPTTGSTLDFHWRVGVNLAVGPIPSTDALGFPFTFFPGAPSLFFPVLWGSQDSAITASQASEFRSAVYTPLTVLQALRWGGVALTAAAAVTATVLVISAMCVRRRKALQALAAEAALTTIEEDSMEEEGASRATGPRTGSGSATDADRRWSSPRLSRSASGAIPVPGVPTPLLPSVGAADLEYPLLAAPPSSASVQ